MRLEPFIALRYLMFRQSYVGLYAPDLVCGTVEKRKPRVAARGSEFALAREKESNTWSLPPPL